MAAFCSRLWGSLLEYNTSKIVHIKSKKVGLINRLIQLAIIGYIIGYVIIYSKGYQETEAPYSSVTTKLKGTSFTNLTSNNGSFPYYGGPFVWDQADYVIPPEENNAFFVATNMIITPDQKQSKCPESPRIHNIECNNDSDCTPMEETLYGHGYKTGSCVESDQVPRTRVCEVYAWCPVELDTIPMPQFPTLEDRQPLLDARNFTVLIKNTVQFPTFKISKRNIDAHTKTASLKACTYDKHKSPLCPIFRLETIVDEAGENFTNLAYEGGVMGIVIKWDCDFDALLYSCEPVYSFSRLDNAKSPIAKGYNFRHTYYFVKNNTLHRTLFKAYGIRFMVKVTGKGGKFSVIPLFLNLGSGLALLGIATVLCDIVVLYVLRKKKFYRDKKYQYVLDNSEEQGLLNENDRRKSIEK